MRELKFILPAKDNVGHPLDEVHRQLRDVLCRTFGGYTASPTFGGWFDCRTGKIVEDPGWVYSIAVASAKEGAELRNITMWAGLLARQEAIYFRGTEGEIEIIELTQAAHVAALRQVI